MFENTGPWITITLRQANKMCSQQQEEETQSTSLTCVHQSAQNKPMILFNPTVYDIFNFRYWDSIYGILLITYIIMTSLFLLVHSPSSSLNSNFIFLNWFLLFSKSQGSVNTNSNFTIFVENQISWVFPSP